MSGLRATAGLARSIVVYRARWWRVGRLAGFYRQFLSPGDLAFDIGAHVGNRTLAMVRAGARVVALEPQATFHRFLSRTMPRQVTVLPLAAGSADGEAQLAVSRLHPTVSSLAPGFGARMGAGDPGFRDVSWDGVETVPITTLDALIKANGLPAFVKIDVEGYEHAVLAGLGTPVAALAFEFLPAAPEITRACLDRLCDLGNYHFNVVNGEAMEFAFADWLDRDSVLAAVGSQRSSGDIYARLDG